jgi:hypothetical protein
MERPIPVGICYICNSLFFLLGLTKHISVRIRLLCTFLLPAGCKWATNPANLSIQGGGEAAQCHLFSSLFSRYRTSEIAEPITIGWAGFSELRTEKAMQVSPILDRIRYLYPEVFLPHP